MSAQVTISYDEFKKKEDRISCLENSLNERDKKIESLLQSIEDIGKNNDIARIKELEQRMVTYDTLAIKDIKNDMTKRIHNFLDNVATLNKHQFYTSKFHTINHQNALVKYCEKLCDELQNATKADSFKRVYVGLDDVINEIKEDVLKDDKIELGIKRAKLESDIKTYEDDLSILLNKERLYKDIMDKKYSDKYDIDKCELQKIYDEKSRSLNERDAELKTFMCDYQSKYDSIDNDISKKYSDEIANLKSDNKKLSDENESLHETSKKLADNYETNIKNANDKHANEISALKSDLSTRTGELKTQKKRVKELERRIEIFVSSDDLIKKARLESSIINEDLRSDLENLLNSNRR